jgi:hypothetical protein
MTDDEFEFRKIVVFDTFAEVDRLLVHTMTDHLEASRSHQAVILGVIINQVRGVRNYLSGALEKMSSDDMNDLIAKYEGLR